MGGAAHTVFAVPGDIDRAHVAGCHALIRDGAILARGAVDVLEVLHMPALPLEAAPAETHERGGSPLVALLDVERALDEIVELTGSSAAEVMSELTMLEFEGAVVRVEGNRYTLRR